MPFPFTEVVCFIGSLMVVNAQLRMDRSKRPLAEALFLGFALVGTLYMQSGGAGRYPAFPWFVGLPGLFLGSVVAACLDSLRARWSCARGGGKP